MEISPGNKFRPAVVEGVSERKAYFLASLVLNIGPAEATLTMADLPFPAAVAALQPNAVAGSSQAITAIAGPSQPLAATAGPSQPNSDRQLVSFPKLAAFFREHFAAIRGVPIYYPDRSSNLISVNVNVDYKYCENIKRHHKSNYIFFMIDVAREIGYQKCYDKASCKRFRSQPFHIPIDVMDELQGPPNKRMHIALHKNEGRE